MSDAVIVFLLSLAAGSAIPAGAVLARFDLLHPTLLSPQVRHFVVAFGGGALISAVALVLVPDGVKELPMPAVVLCFSAGGVFFYLLERVLSRLQSPAGQLVAMLADFIPEAIALGTAFAIGEETGVLLALLMVLQNLPEGFNAYEELAQKSRLKPGSILLAFSALAIAGPVSALGGYYLLANASHWVAGLMLFASAGILYLVFQDVAPASRLAGSKTPALGAVLGFLLGLVGNMLL